MVFVLLKMLLAAWSAVTWYLCPAKGRFYNRKYQEPVVDSEASANGIELIVPKNVNTTSVI